MRHKTIIRFLLIFICLALSNSCADENLNESQSKGDTLVDKVTEVRNYFESTSPALCQIKLGSSSCGYDHDHTRSENSAFRQSSNLIPDWDKARTWDAYKCVYIEVPLKGDGIFRSSFLDLGRRRKSYPVRSFLVLVNDKATGAINYHVVTMIVETKGNKKPAEEDFHYLGNSDFNGFILFSKVDGTSGKALHVHNHKSHLIRIGAPMASTRTSFKIGSAGRGYMLSLTPAVVRYSYDESGGTGGTGGGTGQVIYCFRCGMPYDIAFDKCPNGCEVVVRPDEFSTYCDICGSYYNGLIYNSCPNGCSSLNCWICGQFPCICYHACERCGSFSCPGPWYCSNNGCTGVKCNICGGYKTNTRSSSDCPPCTCTGGGGVVPTPDPGEADKIIIDDYSFDTDLRAKCILERLLNIDGGFKNMIQQFDGNFTGADLKFSLSYNLPNIVGAITHKPAGSMIEIELNGNILECPNLIIVSRLAHEVIHAEMFRVLLRLANKNGAIDVNKLSQSLTEHNYPVIYEYYRKYGVDDFQHEQMAQRYRKGIISILKGFDPFESDYIYEALAWEGLKGTTAWENLNGAERNSINNNFVNYNNKGIELCQ